jgi:hypothetical protein
MCRGYSVILVTDGAESCGGDPVAAARRLHDTFGVQVYVIAVSDLGSELASVDAISNAGSGGMRPRATVVTRPDQLVPRAHRGDLGLDSHRAMQRRRRQLQRAHR